MKILFFSYAYPNPANPGVGTFNRTMIAGLSQNNDVRVISPVPFVDAWKAWWRGRLPQGLNDSTFQAVPNVPAEYCRWYYTPKIFREHYGRFMQRSVRTALNRAMEEFRPDLVLSYWTYPDGEVAVNTAHQYGVRAVTIVGGTDVLISGRHGARRNATLNVLRAADGIITVSDDIKNVLIADGIPAAKLSVVRRGIDYRLFHKGSKSEARRTLGLLNDRARMCSKEMQSPHPQPLSPQSRGERTTSTIAHGHLEDVPILISVGRLVDIKGHSNLIEACRLLAERGIQFKCYLLGEGPLRSSLKQQIEQAGLSHRVELRSSCVPAQLAEWYRAADLTVLPSVSEGVPNVLLESIASGTPFVASRVGGIPEIADLSLDRLVPPADPGELAHAIAECLASNLDSSGRAQI